MLIIPNSYIFTLKLAILTNYLIEAKIILKKRIIYIWITVILKFTFGVRIRDSSSTKSCCISSSSSWPTPDSSESSWWLRGGLPLELPLGTPADVELADVCPELEPIFGPPLVLLLLLPIPLEPLPELGLRKLVLSEKERVSFPWCQ